MKWKTLAPAVGRRIRALRKASPLTIEALADKAGVGAVYLGNVERGGENPSLKVLAALADALGLGIAQLLDVDADLTDKEARDELQERLKELPPTDMKKLLRMLRALRE